MTGNEIAFSGVGGPGQIVAVQLADGTVYSVPATADPATLAAALAAAVPGATASGAVLTMPASGFVVRVGGPITEEREVRRQLQGVRVILWCPTPAVRDAAALLRPDADQASDVPSSPSRVRLSVFQTAARSSDLITGLGGSGPAQRPSRPTRRLRCFAGGGGFTREASGVRVT